MVLPSLCTTEEDPDQSHNVPILPPQLGTGCRASGFSTRSHSSLLTPVMYWLQITVSLTTAGKGRKGNKHKTFDSWSQTKKKLHHYMTSKKLCLFPFLPYSPKSDLDFNMVNTLREWWCCITKNSSCRWIGLLPSVLFWVSSRCWRTTGFLISWWKDQKGHHSFGHCLWWEYLVLQNSWQEPEIHNLITFSLPAFHILR